MSEIDRSSWDNLQRKLNEANERIVEFEGIKAGHMRYQQEMETLMGISPEGRQALLMALSKGQTPVVPAPGEFIHSYFAVAMAARLATYTDALDTPIQELLWRLMGRLQDFQQELSNMSLHGGPPPRTAHIDIANYCMLLEHQIRKGNDQ